MLSKSGQKLAEQKIMSNFAAVYNLYLLALK